jgi:putative membrane protein
MFLLATPRWLAELVVTDGGWVWTWLRRLTVPVVATLVFNTVTVLTHWQPVVNRSVTDGPFHYGIHVIVVATALIMWIPVCGPWPQLRMKSVPGTLVYLFLQSVVPTIPGAWLAIAGDAIYEGYDHGDHLFGVTTVQDQQAAGVFMKVVTGGWLWTVIIVLFFRWALSLGRAEKDARVLSTDEVEAIESLRRRDREPPVPAGS